MFNVRFISSPDRAAFIAITRMALLWIIVIIMRYKYTTLFTERQRKQLETRNK